MIELNTNIHYDNQPYQSISTYLYYLIQFKSQISILFLLLFSLNPLIFSVLFKPIDDAFGGSFSSEVDWCSTFIFSPEFEGWESLNIDTSNFIFS